MHDVHETGEEGPPCDHKRERRDGVEWSGEDEDPHGEGQQTAQQKRPPGTVIHSLEIVENWGCHDASVRVRSIHVTSVLVSRGRDSSRGLKQTRGEGAE